MHPLTCGSCRVRTHLWEKEPQESQTGTPPPGFPPTSNHHRRSSQTTVHGFLCCQPIERKPKGDIMTWSLCEIHVSFSLKKLCWDVATGTHIVLYLRLRSPHSKQALSGGYSKDDTTYDLSYLLCGPSWEKSADLVFLSPVVGEREPLHWPWLVRLCVKGRSQYSWAKRLFTVGGIWTRRKSMEREKTLLKFSCQI